MKKRILALASALVLVAALVMPMAVFAGDTTGVTGKVAGTPMVTGIDPTSGNPGETIETVTITGSDFEDTGDLTVTMSGEGLTISDSTYVNANTVTFKLVIAADAPAGARDVTVTQAGKSGTKEDAFIVNTVTTISAPSDIALGYMTAGTTETGSSTDGSVETNAAACVVTAKDVKGSNAGYMNTAPDGSGTSLTAKFKISKTSITEGLVDSDAGLTYDCSYGTTPLNLYVSQAVAIEDAAGNYQITITYTVSI